MNKSLNKQQYHCRHVGTVGNTQFDCTRLTQNWPVQHSPALGGYYANGWQMKVNNIWIVIQRTGSRFMSSRTRSTFHFQVTCYGLHQWQAAASCEQTSVNFRCNCPADSQITLSRFRYHATAPAATPQQQYPVRHDQRVCMGWEAPRHSSNIRCNCPADTQITLRRFRCHEATVNDTTRYGQQVFERHGARYGAIKEYARGGRL